jgi:hypothetical protein
MATIAEHTGTIRTLIKNHTDDSYYTDEFLYKLLKDSRAMILEREAKKFYKFSDFSYLSICMPLILDTYHDCDCLPIDIGCKVLKSRFNLPRVLQGRNRDLIKIKTIDGEEIGYVPDSSSIKKLKYSRTQKNKIKYTIVNNHLVIFNNTSLKAVIVELVPEDPLDLSNITLCNEDGEDIGPTCFDYRTENFPIKQALHMPMYEELLKFLNLPLSIPEDLTNDTIKQHG